MKNKISFLLVCLLLLVVSSFAQQKEKMTRDEKDEKIQARNARVNNKNDYVIFRRLILGLPEFANERKKIPNLQKSTKAPVKVVAAIDSLEDDDTKSTTLNGYIRQDVGDNSTNMYEITFDRAQKKIVAVKHTQDAIDADREAVETKEEKTTTVTTKEKTVVRKKKTDDDDDDDADEEKPAKGKSKQKDTDED